MNHSIYHSSKVRIYDKKLREYVDNNSIQVITEYNEHVCGADLLGSYIVHSKIPVHLRN